MGQASEVSTVYHERALAKLTRTLRVTGRLDGGYHRVEAEMVMLDFGDDVDIEPLDEAERDGPRDALEVVDAVAWVGDASPVTGWALGPVVPVPEGDDNLVIRALRLVDRRARIRLVKRIPPGAGLGGGSSDAAAVLRWAGVGDPGVAAQLGADVPFCVRGGRAHVSGIGELVAPLPYDDAAYVCYTPGFGVPTGAVYAAFDELLPEGGHANDAVHNDLERAALVVEPRLARVRDLVAEATRRRPVLAGSGSTWYVACTREEGESLVGELAAATLAEPGRASINLGRTVGAFVM